jgi:hypothetical protein
VQGNSKVRRLCTLLQGTFPGVMLAASTVVMISRSSY